MSGIRVLAVDDCPTALVGLRRVLEPDRDIEAVGDAINGEEALSRAEQLSPDMAGLRDVATVTARQAEFIKQSDNTSERRCGK